MQIPSKNEAKAEFEKIEKLYLCYCFAISNADDEHLRKKIAEIAREHLSARINAIKYSVEIVAQNKKDELRKKIAELGKDQSVSSSCYASSFLSALIFRVFPLIRHNNP